MEFLFFLRHAQNIFMMIFTIEMLLTKFEDVKASTAKCNQKKYIANISVCVANLLVY